MPIEMNDSCPQCGENKWSNHGTNDIPIMKEIPEDVIEKYRKGEIETDFEEYRAGYLKTAGFTCKSCGYTVMKDEKGGLHPQDYTDIEK